MPYPSSYLTSDSGHAYAPSSRVYTKCASDFVESFGSDNAVVKTFLSLILNHVKGCATSRHEELRVWIMQDWNQDLKRRGQDGQNLRYDNGACGTGRDEVFEGNYIIGGAAKQALCLGDGDGPLKARMKRLFREIKLLIITDISRLGTGED